MQVTHTAMLNPPDNPPPSIPTGRYAPSPTGALHLGNLRTAVAAWAQARAKGQRFLLRVEDLDGPRSKPEFEQQQLADLRALGIDWDAAPLRQSERHEVYAEHFQRLIKKRLVYPCFCSRKEIAEAASAPHGGMIRYPGTCAALPWHEGQARIEAGAQHCWRIRVQLAPKLFFDAFAGECPIDLEEDGGDFVVRRADGLFGYQFACAVDDALSGVTEVLRGADLLASGLRQSWVLACLDLPVPKYLHIPLLRRTDGERLSKRAGSEAMATYQQQGISPAGIFSFLAWTLGQVQYGEKFTPQQLVARWDVYTISKDDFLFAESMLEPYRDRTI